MAIETTIARHYAWRNIIFAIVCLALGLWGVYDYVYAIPAQARNFERGQVCRHVKEALEPGGWSEAAAPAKEAVAAGIEKIIKEHMDESAIAELDADELRTADEATLAARAEQFKKAIESIKEHEQDQWLLALVLFDQALKAGEPAMHPLTGVHLLAHDVASQGVDAVASISQPGAFDRHTQWLFILSLPFVPWAMWVYFRTKLRVYRLEDNGTLHLPEGVWERDEIADINMDRWMSKSIAEVVHTDGRRAVLDDYKHKNLHLIVGAIASRLYPEKWTAEAKVVKPGAAADAGSSAEAADVAAAEPSVEADASSTQEI